MSRIECIRPGGAKGGPNPLPDDQLFNHLLADAFLLPPFGDCTPDEREAISELCFSKSGSLIGSPDCDGCAHEIEQKMSATSVCHKVTPHVTRPWNRLWFVWPAIGLCWLLVVASLGYPAFYVAWPQGKVAEYPAVSVFFFGWLGLFSLLDGNFQMIGWLANPFFFGTSICLGVRLTRMAAATGVLSVAFAFASFLLKSAIMNEAGHEGPVTAFATGFQLWLTAICLQAALALFLATRRPKALAAPIFED